MNPCLSQPSACPSSPRRRLLHTLYWLPPLLLWAGDAMAWGLYTHIWFAQALLWMVPLADPRFRDAARRLPRLVLAGACLPDLALMGGVARSDKLHDSHDWEIAALQLQNASSDEERALALGYASHLLTDIFAHNHFVPSHERVWADIPVLTHASCEWALDYHVRGELFHTPGKLLMAERKVIGAYLHTAFDCRDDEAQRLIMSLARADRLLRFSRLPALAHAVGRSADRRMVSRFNFYLEETAWRLPQINGLIAGECPQWHANPPRHLAQQMVAAHPMELVRQRMDLPENVFIAESLT